MIKLALQSSEWVTLSTWEAEQENWLPTLDVLEHYKKESIQKYGQDVRLIFLCGADLVNSFTIPDVWTDEHVKKNFL
jgi:nicotinamide mononucleotide adenylyltransferase